MRGSATAVILPDHTIYRLIAVPERGGHVHAMQCNSAPVQNHVLVVHAASRKRHVDDLLSARGTALELYQVLQGWRTGIGVVGCLWKECQVSQK